MSDIQLKAAEAFAASLRKREWDGGVRIVVQGAMRAIVAKGSVDLDASWRADVFTEGRQRKASFTLIAETPEQLFKDLAALSLEPVS